MTREEFREIRKGYGLTQRQWAQALGLSLVHVANIERGSKPLSDIVSRLAEMYRRHGLMSEATAADTSPSGGLPDLPVGALAPARSPHPRSAP